MQHLWQKVRTKSGGVTPARRLDPCSNASPTTIATACSLTPTGRGVESPTMCSLSRHGERGHLQHLEVYPLSLPLVLAVEQPYKGIVLSSGWHLASAIYQCGSTSGLICFRLSYFTSVWLNRFIGCFGTLPPILGLLW